jgi:hypothetical protein
MENYSINIQFLTIFSGVTCGILSVDNGGFGSVLPDESLHLLVFITVAFVNFYLSKLNFKRYRAKCIILIIIISLYGTLINTFLLFIAAAIQITILIIPDRKVIPSPDICRDSPLIFGLKHFGTRKRLLCLLYALILVILT